MKKIQGSKTLLLSILLPALGFASLLFTCITAFAQVKAAGGAKAYPLSMNKVYRKYDITGDGRADRIKINSDANSEGYINQLTVIVNGKKCLTKKYSNQAESASVLRAYPEIVLVRLKNKKPFLYIHFSTYNGYYAGGWVYRYQKQKLQEIFDTNLLIRKYRGTRRDVWRPYEVLSRVSENKAWFYIGSSTTGSRIFKISLSSLKPPVSGKDLSRYYRKPYSQIKSLFYCGTDITDYAEYNHYEYNSITFSFPKPVAKPSKAPLEMISLTGEMRGCTIFGVKPGMSRQTAFAKLQRAGFTRTSAVGITYYWEDAQKRQIALEADSKVLSIRFGMW